MECIDLKCSHNDDLQNVQASDFKALCHATRALMKPLGMGVADSW